MTEWHRAPAARYSTLKQGSSANRRGAAGPCRFAAIGLAPLRQISLGQWRSGRLGLHHNVGNSPASGFFDHLNAVDTARDLLAVAVQRGAPSAPSETNIMRASSINRAFMQARSLSAGPVIAASSAAGTPSGSEGSAQPESSVRSIFSPTRF